MTLVADAAVFKDRVGRLLSIDFLCRYIELAARVAQW